MSTEKVLQIVPATHWWAKYRNIESKETRSYPVAVWVLTEVNDPEFDSDNPVFEIVKGMIAQRNTWILIYADDYNPRAEDFLGYEYEDGNSS